MGSMKTLATAIEEANTLLSRSEPLDGQGLDSLLDTLHQVAAHGNDAVVLLARRLLSPDEP
jgi:hypothetical protein